MSEDMSDRPSGPRMTGDVKWFDVTAGYGFISLDGEAEVDKTDIFVHRSAITARAPDKEYASLNKGEKVEFCVVQGKKGDEASDVTGLGRIPVEGCPYGPRGGGARGGFRGGRGFYQNRGGYDDGYQYDGPPRGRGRGGFRGRGYNSYDNQGYRGGMSRRDRDDGPVENY